MKVSECVCVFVHVCVRVCVSGLRGIQCWNLTLKKSGWNPSAA